jgi:hypothetical protein
LIPLIYAEKLASLPKINRPHYFEVYDDQIYIGENSSISLYSLKDFSLIKKFGKKGEGPGEFKTIPIFKVFPNCIVVNNFGKWLLFSRNGDFLEERRDTLFKLFLYPVGRNYVATTTDPSPTTKNTDKIIILLDKDLKPTKEIARKENKLNIKGRRNSYVIKDVFDYRVFGDKIFLGDTRRGFHIVVFDSNGNKLYEINKKYQPIKVTEKYKKAFLNRQKQANDIVSKMERRYGYKYVFPDYFPAYRDFRVKDSKIYFFTYKKNGQKSEIIVMDIEGKSVKHVFVPRGLSIKLCSFSNDRFFYLKENIDKEEWELFAEDF